MEQFVPSISHIVCIDRMGLIGEGNNLIWKIPEEMSYFKETTENSIVLMGGNTFRSINSKPLKNRINIVVSSSITSSDSNNLYFRNSIEDSLELAQYLGLKDQKNIFIIGGESIYEQTFSLINKVYISVIHHNYIHDPILKDKKVFYYYNYEKLDIDSLELESKSLIKSTNYFYPISTYIFKVNSNDGLE